MNRQHLMVRWLSIVLSLLFLTTATVTHANVNSSDVASVNGSNAQNEAATSKNNSQQQSVTTYLFVQSSNKATIESHKKEPNTYLVTLNNVSPYVTYFTERPKRIANTMPMEQFLKLWDHQGDNSFQSNAPNADFNGIQVGFLSPDKPINIVLELSQPVYDAKARTLVYTAKPLEGNTTLIPTSGTLEHVILFIDDACLSCW